MQIVNRKPSLPERGKIKIGKKGEPRTSQGGAKYSPPVKLDHFIITGMDRDKEGNFIPDVALMEAIAEKTGQDAKKLTRIPVRLLYNDPALNMGTRYAAYKGRSVWCSGNGETAQRAVTKPGQYEAKECPCERIEQGYEGDPKCKINGVLSVLIDGAPGVGGVWKFRTTSFNSVDGLAGSLAFMAAMTGGQLANLPLELVLREKMGILPDGKQQKIYIVAIEYAGNLDELRDAGYKIALENSKANLRIEHIEAEARKSMEVGDGDPAAVFPDDDAEDVGGEFYPEGEQREGNTPELQDPAGSEGPKPAKAASKKKTTKVIDLPNGGYTAEVLAAPPKTEIRDCTVSDVEAPLPISVTTDELKSLAKTSEVLAPPPENTEGDEGPQNDGAPPPSDKDAPPLTNPGGLDEDVF